MNAIIKEYKKYLAEYFHGLKIQKPLFFNGKFALRFDLQVGETATEDYFREVIKRSTSLFEVAFDPKDEIFLVYRKLKWKKGKIRFGNYCFKQVSQLKKSEINYSIIHDLYEKGDIQDVAVLKSTVKQINYFNILTAIANTDFPPRQPRLHILGSEEIYFINTSKNLIFHMYDDRGLDIIASNVETLKPIYSKYRDWILEVNRGQIDNMFQ
jgi:hypothetical protein